MSSVRVTREFQAGSFLASAIRSNTWSRGRATSTSTVTITLPTLLRGRGRCQAADNCRSARLVVGIEA
jgi:hypothetical protein